MDEQEAFDNARGMFMTEGWKEFIDEVEGLIETLTLDSASTSDEFFHCKGRLEALRAIAGYENAVLASEAQYDDERVSH